MTLLYGTRCNEVLRSPGKESVFCEGSSWKVRQNTPASRQALCRAIGATVLGVAPVIGDPTDMDGLFEGAGGRFAKEIPFPEPGIVRKLREFTRRFCYRWFTPLEEEDYLSNEEWLKTTSYTEVRKEELRKAYELLPSKLTKKHFRVKSFIKLETYAGHKYLRWINSRCDAFKVFSGPLFKAIESKVYDLGMDGSFPFRFIKHVPVPERVEFLTNLFESVEGIGCYAETDHTAFEAHMTAEMMRAVELQIYAYFLKRRRREFSVIKRVLLGTNKCVNKYVSVTVPSRRMSGEMNTSLGNGLMNLIIFLFMCQELGKVPLAGVVEGDDGLFAMQDTVFDKFESERFGMELKMEKFNHFSQASFCGMCFDQESGVILRDISRSLAKFGWSHSNLKFSKPAIIQGLLKAKALSLVCEVAGCPVLHTLAARVLDQTCGVEAVWDPREFGGDYWMKQVQEHVRQRYGEGTVDLKLSTPIPLAARRRAAAKYGWSIQDQLHAEAVISTCDLVNGHIDDAVILNKISSDLPDFVEMSERYVVTWPAGVAWDDITLPF